MSETKKMTGCDIRQTDKIFFMKFQCVTDRNK